MRDPELLLSVSEGTRRAVEGSDGVVSCRRGGLKRSTHHHVMGIGTSDREDESIDGIDGGCCRIHLDRRRANSTGVGVVRCLKSEPAVTKGLALHDETPLRIPLLIYVTKQILK